MIEIVLNIVNFKSEWNARNAKPVKIDVLENKYMHVHRQYIVEAGEDAQYLCLDPSITLIVPPCNLDCLLG